MTINKGTITSVVNDWARGRQPAWTIVDTDAICTAMIEVSQMTTPHIVSDIVLSDAEIQQIFLVRVISAIDERLVRAAAGLRQTLRIVPLVRTPGGAIALGLRSATDTELGDLPGVSPKRATDMARLLALRPDISSIDELTAIPGIGTTTLGKLKELTYLDQPRTSLVSASLLAFCSHPTVVSYLDLLDKTDLEVISGDGNTLTRHPPLGGTTVERFIRLLKAVQDDAQRRLSPASGILASNAKRYLTRHLLSQEYRDKMTSTDGEIVINDAYLSVMIDIIASANNSLRLAAFVVTATPDEHSEGGTEAIIEALEARATAGVAVQVILDRDEPGDPYKSSIINRPVIERLRAARIAVKQDDPGTLLHSKFLIADKSSVIVGSHNLTKSSLSSTYELSVRLDSVSLVEAFIKRFDSLWGLLH